jgi:Ca-activated chloride channel family protein
MTFLHPEFLYYMLPPLFILFGLLLTQKESHATFFSEEVMEKLRVSANTLTLKARNALFMLMGFFIIIALAGPVIEEGKIEIKAKSADIMVALDISDSMLAQDVYPNRLKLAKQKALELLRLAPNERIGVIAFAKNSYLVSPLSFDHDAVSFLLRQLSTDSITEKGTDLLSMLEVVDKSIKDDSKKYLLILSDGGDEKDFSREIDFAKEKNIAIFVLGVGTTKGAPVKLSNGQFIKKDGEIIVSQLNEEMAKLATKTGGVFIESVNANDDIKTMLREIEKHSEQKELKSQEIARFIPLFYYPVGLALLLLLIATSSMSKREKVQLPSAFLLVALAFHTPSLDAGLLDFVELEEAKKAYESGDFVKSAQMYGEYATSSTNGESFYNAGNAFYKEGKYKEAIASYEKATFDNKESRAKNFANIGNAYAKQPNEENLKKAVESYEESLKLQDDKETKENLEAVKKALEKQEEQKEDSKDNKEQNDKKEKSDKSDKSDKEEKSDKKDEKSQDKKDKDKDEKSSQDMKSKEQSKDEKSEQNKSQEKKEQEQEKQNKSDENNQSKEQKQNQAKQQQEKQDKAKELEKDVNATAPMQAAQPAQMSDSEESKWLNKLNQQQSTYLYMLNETNSQEENPNEKPW